VEDLHFVFIEIICYQLFSLSGYLSIMIFTFDFSIIFIVFFSILIIGFDPSNHNFSSF